MNDDEMNDWRDDVSDDAPETLKVDEETPVIITFKDTGTKKSHPEFGNSIVFTVQLEGEEETKRWYVNPENYSLLRQIKELGDVLNLKVKVTRTGMKRTDTRYTLEKVE